MDICRNISVSGGLQYQYQQQQQRQPEYQLGSLDDLFSGHPLEEEGNVNMEWLSTFVEECFSSKGNCLLPPTTTQAQPFLQQKHLMKPTRSFGSKATVAPSPLQFDKLVIPVKGTRSKRKRSQSRKTKATWWSPPPHPQNLLHTSDPPLLQQAHWLADSELIFPHKQQQQQQNNEQEQEQEQEQEEEQESVVSRHGRRKKVKKQSDNDNNSDLIMEEEEESSSNGTRRCSHCLSQRTPQWRAGPLGPKTLCNACGVRYKSGRLLPEYRPAKSPSFVSYMHSNSHKKVLEMRTLSFLTSDSSSSSPC